MAKRYTDENVRKAVKDSVSYSGVLRCLGIKQAGGSQSHIKRRVETLGLDTSHFTGQGHNRGKTLGPKRTVEEILVRREASKGRDKSSALHRALQERGKKYECAICKNDGHWQGQSLTLQVDHIDGDWTNNLEENLRYLCPNCHWQTPNHGAKNKPL